MRALVLAPFHPPTLESLAKLMPVDYESWTETRRLQDPEELGLRLRKEHVTHLIVEADFIFEETFQNAADLRFLGICRAALNHVDLDAATEHDVLVVNTPGRNARAVAELTLGLMLSLARQISHLDGYVKSGRWEDPVDGYVNHRGLELEGLTLGLIGLGAVGSIVSKLAGAFGMRVLAHDPYAGSVGEQRYGALLVPLKPLLQQSNFLSLHAPATSETTGMIGHEELATLPPVAFLVNTAFYEMVQEDALVQALTTGPLAGAALDVHETHPISPASPLIKLPNVILTPHVGGATEGTVQRHSEMMLQEIQRHLRGEKPINLANPRVWESLGR